MFHAPLNHHVPWSSKPFGVAEPVVHSFFSRPYQIVDLATPKVSAIYLTGFFLLLLFFQPIDGLVNLHRHLFGPDIEISHEPEQ